MAGLRKAPIPDFKGSFNVQCRKPARGGDVGATQRDGPSRSDRDPYLDALRAGALLIVVFGHWIATLPRVEGGGLVGTEHILNIWAPAGYFTWLVQVVPLFVFVSAAVSSDGVRQRLHAGQPHCHWWADRALGLARPTVTYLAVLVVVTVIALFTGGDVLGPLNYSLTVHLWFLLTLLGVQALLPFSVWADRRWGLTAVVGLILVVATVDFLRVVPVSAGEARQFGSLVTDHHDLFAWLNAVAVWLVPQQLGIAWWRGRFSGRSAGIGMVLLGAGWLGLAMALDYPVSMVNGNIGGETNLLPPTLAFLGVMWLQIGVVLIFEHPVRRFLQRRRMGRWMAVFAALGLQLYLRPCPGVLPRATRLRAENEAAISRDRCGIVVVTAQLNDGCTEAQNRGAFAEAWNLSAAPRILGGCRHESVPGMPYGTPTMRGPAMLPQSPATSVSLVETLRFLECANSYPDRTGSVSVIETHFSYVFLTDRYVYKLKKTKRYPIVDLSSLAARRANCHEEVQLNRRLAPGVYLGVVTLTRTADGKLSLERPGETVDYLVHMKRLDAGLNLERQLLQGRPREAELDRAARHLVNFYMENTPTGWVDPAVRRARFDAQSAELGQLLDHARGDRLRDRLVAWLDAHGQLLSSRRELEVHGDLRPEHIYLGPSPCMIDRLEFDERLRHLDPVEELAFLTLECERLGQRWVGERFLRHYRKHTGDDPPIHLQRFYEASRALLWALLGARHLITQLENSDRWRRKAAWYIDTGLRLTETRPGR